MLANRVVKVNMPKIRELASQKNMSLKQLESASSLSNGAIGKWNKSDARIDKLYRVADALGAKVDELIEKV